LIGQIGDCLHSPKETLLRWSCSGMNQRYGTLAYSRFQKSVHDLFQIMQAYKNDEVLRCA
jgi:hypothetical protein